MFIAATSFYKKLTLQRSKNIAKAIMPYIGSGKTLLDFGCGNFLLGLELTVQNPDLIVTGIDVISDQNLDLSEIEKSKQLEFKQYDPGALPFPDQSFDLALASSSLHHTDDPEFYVTELKRILKPGGHLIIVEEMYINQIDRVWISAQDYILNNLKKGVPIPLEFRSHKHYLKFFNLSGFTIKHESKIRPCFPYMHHYIFHLQKN